MPQLFEFGPSKHDKRFDDERIIKTYIEEESLTDTDRQLDLYHVEVIPVEIEGSKEAIIKESKEQI